MTDEEWLLSNLLEDTDSAKSITSDIRDAIIQILEEIRLGMVTGYPDLGIPPLDPLVISHLPFNVTWDDNNVYGNLTESELKDLSTFQTAKVLVSLLGLSIDVGLLLEHLELHGSYFMDGHALGIHVFGDGAYSIRLNSIIFTFYLKLGLGKYLSVKDVRADFSLKDAEVHFEHLMNGGLMGGLINEALSAELPAALGSLEELVLPPLMDLLKNRTNEYLHQYPLIPDFNISQIITDWPIIG
ncbi:uncharacterized protein [Panulirus ornatus]